MNTRCVCFITDQQYLFPTLLSAIQARAHTSNALADVIIFSSEPDARSDEVFGAVCSRESIRYVSVTDAIRDALGNLKRDNTNHFQHKISVSTFGRLFLHLLLPRQYTQFLYLDGDTQITESLDPLIGCAVSPGKFLAARDYCAIMCSSRRPWLKNFDAHTRRLGLSAERRASYFNPGVIRADLESWRTIGTAAYEFFVQSPERCYPHHDQGALNGACADAHILISSRWNFPRQLMHLELGDRPKPAVYHYMAHPKPWHGVFLPWGRREHSAYPQLVQRYPELSNYWPRLSDAYHAAYKIKAAKNYLVDLWSERSDNVDLDTILNDENLREPAQSRAGAR